MAGSYQPRRAIIIMASMTWLIKNQFHWDNLMLALMGGAGSVFPILSMHLQGKGICLESSFPQNWKLLKMLFFPKPSLAWQPVDAQRSWAAAAFPGTYQTFSQLNIFGFGLVWVLCFVLFFSPKENSKTETFCRICTGSVTISQEKVSLSMGVWGRQVESKT